MEEENFLTGLVFMVILILIGTVLPACCRRCCCCFSCGEKKKKKKELQHKRNGKKEESQAFSVNIAYFLHVVSGHILALHHFYLGRVVHGFLAIMSFNFFGLGYIADYFLIPRFVREANQRKCAGYPSICNIVWKVSVGVTVLWLIATCLVAGFVVSGPDILHSVGIVDMGDAPRNPYDVLGVTSQSTVSEIRAAYKGLARKWHPDRNPNCGEPCIEKMQNINEAFENLKSHDFSIGTVSDTSVERWMYALNQMSVKYKMEASYETFKEYAGRHGDEF